MHEITLENGARVRARPVPPHVEALFNKGIRESIPQEPRAPVRRVKMADGHFEEDILTEGPEWDAYQEALTAWEDERNDIVVDAFVGYDVLKRDYAVVEWITADEQWHFTIERDGEVHGQAWQRDVPDDWQFPDALTRAGVESCGNRRVDFIGIELLTTNADVAALEAIATGDSAPITDEEAARVRAGFRTRRRRGGHAATTRKSIIRRLADALTRRNASRKGVGTDA